MEKKKGIGGFIGSIFKGSSKSDEEKEERPVKRKAAFGGGRKNKIEEEEVKAPPKKKSVGKKAPSKRKPPVEDVEEEEVIPLKKKKPASPSPKRTEGEQPPVRKPQPKQSSKGEGVHDVEREYYTGDESKDIYGAKTMEQNIFLYSPPSKFLAIQQYINDSFEGVTVVGTSNLSKVNEEFESKLNCKHMLIFIDNDVELQGLLSCIQTGINIKTTNLEILHIYLVLTNKKVGAAKLNNLKDSHLTNVFTLTTGLDKLSTGIIDQIMAKIIEKQPAYVKTTKLEVPKVAVKKNTLDTEIFKLKNLDALKSEMGRIRSEQGSATAYDTLSDKVTYAKGIEDIEDIKNMIPELSVLEEYKESLDEYLESAQGNINAKDLNEILISKLEITLLQEQTLKDIFGTLIDTAKQNAESEDEKVRKTNENVLDTFRPLMEDNDLKDMLGERAKLKDTVSQGFMSYKKEVQLVSNAIETRRYLFQDMQKSIQSIVGTKDEKVNDAVVQTAMMVQKNLEQGKLEMLEDKTQIEQRLMRTLNFTNSLLRDYNVIVSLDEIIIDRLLEDNQRLETAAIKQVYQVDNPIKAKAKTFMLLDKEDFLKITQIIFAVDTLIVTNMDFTVGKRLTKKTSEEFLQEEYTNKDINVIKLSGNETVKDKDNLIKKLKYIAPNFNKVIFLYDNEIMGEWMDEALVHSSEIIYLSSANKEQLLELNGLKQESDAKDLYGTTVIINNWDRENAGDNNIPTLAEMRTLGNFREGAKELYINTKQAVLDKEELKNLVLLFRSL